MRERIHNRFVSRRQFLIGVGGAMLALPPLVSLRKAHAANGLGGKKVRAVIWTGMLGIDPHHFFPGSVPTSTPAPGVTDLHYTPLGEFDGPLSRVLDGDFASLRSKMNVYEGLSLCGGKYQGHNESVLSGTHSGGRDPQFGKTIDVVLEQSPSVYGPDEAVARRAMRLIDHHHLTGFSFDRVGGERRISSSTRGDQNMFNALFATLPQPDGNQGPTPKQQNQTLIVDRVLADLRQLESHPRLSGDDRQVLQGYVDGVHEVQKKVAANQTSDAPACTVPDLSLESNTAGNGYKFPYDARWGIEDVGAMYDNIAEMTRLAFACDLTRVVFIGATLWSDRPIGSGSDGGLHHECPSSETSADRQQYPLKKLLRLAQGLDATADPQNDSGTLLDNSILLYANELGAWTTSHSTLNMPSLTFGSGGGYFQTGYYLDYRQRPLRSPKGYPLGRPYKQLLQSVMRSMGVQKSEYSQFGDGNGFGEFKAGINQFGYNDPDVFRRYESEHNDPLPFVSNES